MAEIYDWTRFQIHSYVGAQPEDVFRYWATAAGLESFFIRTAEFRSKGDQGRDPDEIVAGGDHYLWHFLHDFKLQGKIIEVTEQPSVTFTFGDMEVMVSVHAVDSGSLVRLEQYHIPAETDDERAVNHLNCRSCWVFYLANLKSICETGHDLREHDPGRSDSASIHFQPSELE